MVETKREGEAPPTEHAPSLVGFIQWLETKGADEQYSWICGDICAVGQYADSLGPSMKKSFMGSGNEADEHCRVWRRLNRLAFGVNTFGALLPRAIAAL